MESSIPFSIERIIDSLLYNRRKKSYELVEKIRKIEERDSFVSRRI